MGLLVEDLERSLEFYQGVLGLELNPARPDKKLPYRGAWLWIGSEMIHLMQLPNPDTLDMDRRPEHGGRDRHFCIGESNIFTCVYLMAICLVRSIIEKLLDFLWRFEQDLCGVQG